MVLGTRNLLVGLVNLILAVVAFFIGLRIIFELLAANTATPFVSWVYQISDNFIRPFRGMFPNLGTTAGVNVDVVAIVALVVYALVAYLVIALIDMMFAQATTVDDRTEYIDDNGHTRRHHVHAHDVEH